MIPNENFHQSFFILVEELVQLEQLTDVTLACGDGTNHQVDNYDNRRYDLDADNCRWERLEYFLSTAFVCALADALGVLSLLPPPAQREQAQGETPYHPPSRGQPEAYAAVIALYVQVSRF